MSRRLIIAVLCIVILCVIWLVPLSVIDNGASLCLFKNLTGRECPGCGMTRAICHLLHGDVTTAVNFNWRVVVVAPLMVFVIVKTLWRRDATKRGQ